MPRLYSENAAYWPAATRETTLTQLTALVTSLEELDTPLEDVGGEVGYGVLVNG
jgi:exonuclease VII small subunit